MTQQSLITRLKAVEEALEDSIRYVSMEGSNEEYANHKAVLSDLRELIKEAKEQEQELVNCSACTFSSCSFGCQHFQITRYTALGEKP